MKMFWKALLTALLVAGAATTMSARASAQSYGYDNGDPDPNAYGPGGSYDSQPDNGAGFSYDSGGYCDDYGCPDDYYDMPVYYGSVFYGDEWLNGPVYYRDWYGRRQYWIHGGWRFDEWRGPRPGWWHEGRYGPALGQDFYRSHGFRGRFDNNRGFDNRNFQSRAPENRGFDNRGLNDARSDGRGFQDRGSNHDRQNIGRPNVERRNFDRHDFNPRDFGQRNFGQRDFRNNTVPQQAPQIRQTRQPAPQQSPAPRQDGQHGSGDRDHHHDH